jgi:hypothetical protein
VEPEEEPIPNPADLAVLAILAAVDGLEPDKAEDILRRVRAGESANGIHTAVGGNRQTVLAAVKAARGVV